MNNSAMLSFDSKQWVVSSEENYRLVPTAYPMLHTNFWGINDKGLFSEARTDRVEQKANI